MTERAPEAGPSEIATGPLLAYAAPAVPLAAALLPVTVYVPGYYAAQLGLPIAAVGLAMLAVRIVDAVVDPIIGWAADRWRPRFGRRRTWVLAATLPTAAAALALLAPPAGAGIPWLLIAGVALSVAWSCMQVPWLAWGAELSRSYGGRTRVAAWREAATALGTLLALALPAVTGAMGVAAPWGGQLTLLGLFVAATLPAAALIAIRLAPEPRERSVRRARLRDSLPMVLANAPFRRLMAAFFINGLANGFPAALFLLFVEHRIGSASAAGPLLLVYFTCGVIGVPFWFRLAKVTSKHRAWALSMALACAGFAPAAFAGPGDIALYLAVCIVSGLAVGADLVLPTAMQADAIDVDTAGSGEERTGLYLGLWALAAKLSLAAAVGIAFPLLGAMGFDPGRQIATPAGLAALAFAYAILPIPLKLAAIALVWSFPIDERRQQALGARIAAGNPAAG